MKMSRREFVAASLAGAGGLCVGGGAVRTFAAETPAPLPDEDGYKLWLRYAPPPGAAENYRKVVVQFLVGGSSATSRITRWELRSAANAMLGSTVRLADDELQDGTIIVGTPINSALVRDLNWTADLRAIGDEGFIVRSARIADRSVTVIAADTEIAAL